MRIKKSLLSRICVALIGAALLALLAGCASAPVPRGVAFDATQTAQSFADHA